MVFGSPSPVAALWARRIEVDPRDLDLDDARLNRTVREDNAQGVGSPSLETRVVGSDTLRLC
jgi:hypothetical protein